MKVIITFVTLFFCICSYAQNPGKINTSTVIPKDRVWYVTDFGAKGDGKTLNTSAIQDAIDACNDAGGGTVRVTPGTFVTGTLFLKDNVRLYVDANAVIMGSGNRDDYKPIQSLNVRHEPVFAEWVSFLVFADHAKHISIEGQGEINGNGDTFWTKDTYIFREDIIKRRPLDWRPRGLVCFLNCQYVSVFDITLANSPCYTLWPLGCDDVNIDGITIRNPVDGPNTDGIDMDCCRRVTVANCNIEGGDDAICLKSDGAKLGKERPCENVVVTNCILSSPPACGVRIGYEGDSPIRNCNFSNLSIYNTHHGIDIISILPNETFPFTIKQGTRVENIQFDNIVMNKVIQPVYLWMGNEKPDVEPRVLLKNIRISNVIASGAGDSFIGSKIDQYIENIFLSNIHIIINRHINKDVEYSNLWYIGENPYGLFVTTVDGLYIDGLSVDFAQASGYWKHAVYCENTKNAVLSKITTKSKGSVNLISQIGATNSLLKILYCNDEKDVKFVNADENSNIIIKKYKD